MKKLFFIGLLVLLSLPLVLSACGSGDLTVTLDKEFTLAVGRTASFTDASLKIEFVEVTGDSRCPAGVQCIQAGEVTCLMKIHYSDSEASMSFTQLGGNENTTMDFNVYQCTFTVEPYPQSGKEIKPQDYKMVMTVTRFQK